MELGKLCGLGWEFFISVAVFKGACLVGFEILREMKYVLGAHLS
jgi:hypothetical protein